MIATGEDSLFSPTHGAMSERDFQALAVRQFLAMGGEPGLF